MCLKPSCALNMRYRQSQAVQHCWHNSWCYFAFVHQVPEKVAYLAINLVIHSNRRWNSLFQFCFYEPHTVPLQALSKSSVGSYICTGHCPLSKGSQLCYKIYHLAFFSRHILLIVVMGQTSACPSNKITVHRPSKSVPPFGI